MADAKKCDRCEALYELSNHCLKYEKSEREDSINPNFTYITTCKHTGCSTVQNIDLCPKCKDELFAWLANMNNCVKPK